MMKSYKGYLIDLDGTIYRGTELLPDAPLFIQSLREKKIPFLFLTNNSTTTPVKVAERLRSHFKIDVHSDDIYTSAMAAAAYVKKTEGKTAYVVGEEGLTQAVREAGLTENTVDPDFVFVGLHRTVTYVELEKAVLAIHRGAIFILTNADANYPTEKGLLPGAGSIGALIEKATGKTPIVTGKPERSMLSAALERLKLNPEDVLMVGDNLHTDILSGKKSDIDTLLVLTGVSSEKDIDETMIYPTYVRRNLGEWEIT